MTTEQEALRLADLLQDEAGVDGYVHDEAAAMLRKLVAEREADRAAMDDAINTLSAISALDGLDLSEYSNLAGATLKDVVDAAITNLRHRRGETT